MYRIIFTFLLIFSTATNSFSQNNSIRFEHIGFKDGLSQATVNTIYQDRMGFMWFGTQDGLNRYDGYEMEVFRNNSDDSTSINNNFINAILEDSKGNFWIGTVGGGINLYDRKSGIFHPLSQNPNNENDIGKNDIHIIYEDSKGTIWVSTDTGLYKITNFNDPDNYDMKNYQNDSNNINSISDNSIHNIFEDSRGNLWIGTSNGLNKIDANDNNETPTFIPFLTDKENNSTSSKNNVTGITEDSNGSIWVSTFEGLVKLKSNNTQNFYDIIRYTNDPSDNKSLSDDRTNDVIVDQEGEIWVSTYNGINKIKDINATDLEFIHYNHQNSNDYSLSNDNILSIYEDNNENIWVGTRGGGVNFVDKSIRNFEHYYNDSNNLQSLNYDYIWSIYEDSDENILVGTTKGRLNYYDKNENIFTYINTNLLPTDFKNTNIFSIIEFKKKIYLLGTDRGIFKLDLTSGINNPKFKQYKSIPDNINTLSNRLVFKIFKDSRGIFWAGTVRGLNKLILDESGNIVNVVRFSIESEKEESFRNTSVRSIYETSDGTLWVGTHKGLFKLALNNINEPENYIRYVPNPDDPQSLSNITIRSMHEDKAGNLWVATSLGLNKMDVSEETFTTYTKKDGLPNELIYGILADENENLWLSTNEGLSKFSPDTESFENYFEVDGLQSSEFNSGAYFKSKDGKMYFGGINGVTAFNPTDITDINNRNFIPPIVITDFLLFNRSVIPSDSSSLKFDINYAKNISLSYTDYIFAFEFSALNYRQSEKIQYAYMLEGFNDDWIFTDHTNRNAVFTNLRQGEYVFRVKATNDDGVWNEAGTSINISITPPFWETWWFRTFIGFMVFGGVFGAGYWRVNDLSKQNILLDNKVSERTDELKYKSDELETHVKELEYSLDHINKLEGLLPICSGCKKIRLEDGEPKDKKSWVQIEKYISDNSDADFSHGICPDCIIEYYPDLADGLLDNDNKEEK